MKIFAQEIVSEGVLIRAESCKIFKNELGGTGIRHLRVYRELQKNALEYACCCYVFILSTSLRAFRDILYVRSQSWDSLQLSCSHNFISLKHSVGEDKKEEGRREVFDTSPKGAETKSRNDVGSNETAR